MDTWYAVFGAIGAVWFFLNKWFKKLEKIIEPVVREAEQMALDGVIDKADRKAIAMKLLSELEKQEIIKLSFLSRFFVRIIINIVVRKLPDFNVAKELLIKQKEG